MTFPPLDPELSPITGWTRDHWLHFDDAQLCAVRPWATEDFSRIQLPGSPASSGELSDGLEGYARTFLLVAFRVAGEKGDDPHGHLELYRRGLLAGTAGQWPPIKTRSQPPVEAASIALGLQLTREWLWDVLSISEQDQVAAWLAGSSTSAANANNWVLFSLMIAEFLASAGYPHNQNHIEHGLSLMEGWYVGDGWYRDADGDFFDYYCGWAMHLYPLLWLGLLERRDPERAAEQRSRFVRRLEEFLPDHVGFFGGSGSPVYQGRSLIYRYAAVAPLFITEIAGATSPLSPGALRRVASGAAKFFADGGSYAPEGAAPAGEMPAGDGELGLPSFGWQHEFLPMVQSYPGPVSPFWTSKAFVGLLLPADHPVWTAVEEASLVEERDRTRMAPGPNFILAPTADDGIARLLNHGSDKYYGPGLENVEYSRLVYSSHKAPVYDPQNPVDNHIGVLNADGQSSVRMRIHRLDTDENSVVSYYQPGWGREDEADSPWKIATAATTAGGYELRVPTVSLATESQDAGTIDGVPRTIREGGYAIAADAPVETSALTGGVDGEGGTAAVDGSTVFTSGLHSMIWPLLGYSSAGRSSATGLSPLGEHTSVPYLEGGFKGPRSIFASLVRLGGSAVETGPTDVIINDQGGTISVFVTTPGVTALNVRLNA